MTKSDKKSVSKSGKKTGKKSEPQYVEFKVNMSDFQTDKIKKALRTGKSVSIKLKKENMSGEDVLALTKSQIGAIAEAYENDKEVTLKLSVSQLEYNKTVEGGFISAILPFLMQAGKFIASSLIPSLLTGAATGVGQTAGSTVVNKITGNGLKKGGMVVYGNKNGITYKANISGNGLRLSPWFTKVSHGEGMYMKEGRSYKAIDGSGFLLGPDSPFKNIPILGLLL